MKLAVVAPRSPRTLPPATDRLVFARWRCLSDSGILL